jgi:hypothetical protein
MVMIVPALSGTCLQLRLSGLGGFSEIRDGVSEPSEEMCQLVELEM